MYQLIQKDPDYFIGETHTNFNINHYLNYSFDDEYINYSVYINKYFLEDWNHAY